MSSSQNPDEPLPRNWIARIRRREPGNTFAGLMACELRSSFWRL